MDGDDSEGTTEATAIDQIFVHPPPRPPLPPSLVFVGARFVASRAIAAPAAFLVTLFWPTQLGDGTIYLNKPPADAEDRDGAKAPGKPGKEVGFKDPKSGPKWGKAPNGKWGWVDNKGNVWAPTGQGGEAHGGPHWDVQKPGGGYVNVYPGGSVR